MAKAKKDSWEVVTEKIVELLKKGIVPWQRPWNVTGILPYNVVSKKAYRGMNQMLLGACSGVSPVWGTFNQWKQKGGYVRKGEKSTPVIFWKFLTEKDDKGNIIYDSKGREKKIPLIRHSYVFNAEQIEGINLEEYIPKTDESKEFTPVERAEKIVANMPNCPPITHGGGKAYYTPSFDSITMPKPETFKTSDAYYNVLFHEITHSTGHESRVGRELSKIEKKYSFEELIAEMGSCFLSSEAGISINYENSASYIDGWMKKISDDKRLIVRAASAAKKASEYVIGKVEEQKEEKAA